MTEIKARLITAAVGELIIDTSYHLPGDVRKALREAYEKEHSERARYILGECIRNYQTADRGEYPLCQDTGTALFFVEVGEEVFVDGNLNEAINLGVKNAYEVGYLRKSLVNDPIFDRINTKNNTPAVIYIRYVKGSDIKISFLAKGGGGENCSGLRMLTPSRGPEGVIGAVADIVREAGGKPCPPTVIGVGIGATADEAMVLSKWALLRKIGERHPDPRYADMELKILARINESGIGPQGLGGAASAFGVHIEARPCHIASMPVGVSVNCHSQRHGTVTVGENGFVVERERGVNDEREVCESAGKIKRLNMPLTVDDVLSLRAGDIVSLNGVIYTARDAAHKRLAEAIGANKKLPFDMEGQGIYYAGPSPERPGKPIGSCGPTTSDRMDGFTEDILKQGVRAMIGKGPRSRETLELMRRYPAVYLANVGGAAAVTAEKIKSAVVVAYEELGPEAIRRLEVEDFICIVAADSYGSDLYGSG